MVEIQARRKDAASDLFHHLLIEIKAGTAISQKLYARVNYNVIYFERGQQLIIKYA